MESDLLTVEPTVAQFVAANHHAANVFKKHGIDFCCSGGKPLAQACAEKGADFDTVRHEEVLPPEDILPSQDFNNWDTGFLAEYIVQTHHRYLLSELPLLREYTAKNCPGSRRAPPRTPRSVCGIRRLAGGTGSAFERRARAVSVHRAACANGGTWTTGSAALWYGPKSDQDDGTRA